MTGLVLGRGMLGGWYRAQAARHLDVWALGDALRSLDRAARVNPRNPETELMRARCYRQLRDMRSRDDALARARTFGASPSSLRNEITLGRIQTGELADGAENKLAELVSAGLSPHDIAASFISGCLARNDTQRAGELLRAWAADFPDHVHNVYMRGVLLATQGKVQLAGAAFEQALAMESRHELAQLAMAQHYDAQDNSAAAAGLFVWLAQSHPRNPTIALGLARSLRKLGRPERARLALQSIMSQTNRVPELVVEVAQIELESGNYSEARNWFDKATAGDMTNHEKLTGAGIAIALLGETELADRTFEWIADDLATNTAISELEVRSAQQTRRPRRCFGIGDAAPARVRQGSRCESVPACPDQSGAS